MNVELLMGVGLLVLILYLSSLNLQIDTKVVHPYTEWTTFFILTSNRNEILYSV